MTTETQIDGNTLTVRRTYDAAQADVFEAWIDASKTSHWWGCANTSRVASTIEARAGGCYHHLMTIDGVGDHLIAGQFTEFDPPNVLAYTMPGLSEEQILQVRVTFSATPGGTEVVLVQNPLPTELQDVVSAGWTASFERLSGYFRGVRRAA